MRPAGGAHRWPIPEGVEGGAVFSEDGDYRYLLSRAWARGSGFVAFIGLNPSTAEAEYDDPTVRKCCHWAREWGFGGMYMLNLYAYRATDPAMMRAAADPIGPKNDGWIARTVRTSVIAVCAWGSSVKEERWRPIAESVPPDKRYCLGRTKYGHPKHPLYLANATQRESWVICAACGSLATYFDPADGWCCPSCGRTDADG